MEDFMKETGLSLNDGSFTMEKSIEAVNIYNKSLLNRKNGKISYIYLKFSEIVHYSSIIYLFHIYRKEKTIISNLSALERSLKSKHY
jgi:hypothetical protein